MRPKPINTYLCYRLRGDTGDRVALLLVRSRTLPEDISPNAVEPHFLQARYPSEARRFYRRLNPKKD